MTGTGRKLETKYLGHVDGNKKTPDTKGTQRFDRGHADGNK